MSILKKQGVYKHLLSLGTDEFGEEGYESPQPEADTSDEEKDDRFFFNGDGTWLGNYYNKDAIYTSMDELRKKWGV